MAVPAYSLNRASKYNKLSAGFPLRALYFPGYTGKTALKAANYGIALDSEGPSAIEIYRVM